MRRTTVPVLPKMKEASPVLSARIATSAPSKPSLRRAARPAERRPAVRPQAARPAAPAARVAATCCANAIFPRKDLSMGLRKTYRWLSAAAVMAVLYSATLHATTYTVTKTDDTKDGSCDGDCSLREAIDAANANPGPDDITLEAGTYQLKLPN